MTARQPHSDTDPDTERVQLDMLRRAGPDRRLALALSLSQSAIEMSRGALRRLHPEASDQELGLLWVRQNYGPELADAVHGYLARPR